jgi:hypothetical protein
MDDPHDKPASEPDVLPPHPLPPPAADENLEGTNATIHHPDDRAQEHPANPPRRKERGPYVTGNY